MHILERLIVLMMYLSTLMAISVYFFCTYFLGRESFGFEFAFSMGLNLALFLAWTGIRLLRGHGMSFLFPLGGILSGILLFLI